jgi:hypothetical protein
MAGNQMFLAAVTGRRRSEAVVSGHVGRLAVIGTFGMPQMS